MITLEQSILEVVRTLPPEKQQEILAHAEKLRGEPGRLKRRRSGKGLWAGLNITLTAEEIEENQREMWKNFSARRHLMPSVVVDTHSVVWYLAGSPALSKNAEAALDEASAEGHPIYVPSICLVELTYLIEKARLPAAAREILIAAPDDPNGPYALAALNRRVADAGICSAQ